MIKFRKGYNAKVISLIISIVFLCNSFLYASPQNNTTLRAPLQCNKAMREFIERDAGDDTVLAAGKYRKPKHGVVHETIGNGLPEDLRNYQSLSEEEQRELIEKYREPDGQIVIPIKELILGTGLLGHIGLGTFYGEPVVYVDRIFEGKDREDIKQNEEDEIEKWEEKREELGLDHKQMRAWIKVNSNEEGTDYAQKLADQWHEEAESLHPIGPIYEREDVRWLVQEGRVNRIGTAIQAAVQDNFDEYKRIVLEETGIQLEAIGEVNFEIDRDITFGVGSYARVACGFEFVELLNDYELAWVIGHEFTHAQVAQQEIKDDGGPERTPEQILKTAPPEDGELSFLTLLRRMQEMIERNADFERRQEELGDSSGVFLTAHAKFDPAAGKSAYAKAVQIFKEQEQELCLEMGEALYNRIALQIEDYCPPDEERLAALEQLATHYHIYSTEEVYAQEPDVVLAAGEDVEPEIIAFSEGIQEGEIEKLPNAARITPIKTMDLFWDVLAIFMSDIDPIEGIDMRYIHGLIGELIDNAWRATGASDYTKVKCCASFYIEQKIIRLNIQQDGAEGWDRLVNTQLAYKERGLNWFFDSKRSSDRSVVFHKGEGLKFFAKFMQRHRGLLKYTRRGDTIETDFYIELLLKPSAEEQDVVLAAQDQKGVDLSQLSDTVVLFLGQEVESHRDAFTSAFGQLGNNCRAVILVRNDTEEEKRDNGDNEAKRRILRIITDKGLLDDNRWEIMTFEEAGLTQENGIDPRKLDPDAEDEDTYLMQILGIDELYCIPLTPEVFERHQELEAATRA